MKIQHTQYETAFKVKLKNRKSKRKNFIKHSSEEKIKSDIKIVIVRSGRRRRNRLKDCKKTLG